MTKVIDQAKEHLKAAQERQAKYANVRSITIFHSTSSGNKLMGILSQMGMEFLSRSMGPLMVQSKLFKLVQ
eukprot:205890-Pelagomonas_calceolata.AAC.1